MGNDGVSKVISTGTVCLETDIGTKLVLKNVRHAPDVRLHLISTGRLDDDGYCGSFGDNQWKITKGSIIVTLPKKSCGLYWLEASVILIMLMQLRVLTLQIYDTEG